MYICQLVLILSYCGYQYIPFYVLGTGWRVPMQQIWLIFSREETQSFVMPRKNKGKFRRMLCQITFTCTVLVNTDRTNHTPWALLHCQNYYDSIIMIIAYVCLATGSFNFKPDLIEMQNDSTQESYFGREVFNCFHRVKMFTFVV